MRKLIVTEFITIDGVFEDPGGSEKFERGGWAFEYDRGDEGDKFKDDELKEADISLFGAKTYDGFAEAWPSRIGAYADKLNSMPKYVVSSKARQLSWQNSKLITGNIAEEIAKLKSGDGGTILVVGSGTLANFLIDHNLVDELRLMVHPVILGTGKKLFDREIAKVSLKLVEATPLGDDGVVILGYQFNQIKK